jgi:hypothetical protein
MTHKKIFLISQRPEDNIGYPYPYPTRYPSVPAGMDRVRIRRQMRAGYESGPNRWIIPVIGYKQYTTGYELKLLNKIAR